MTVGEMPVRGNVLRGTVGGKKVRQGNVHLGTFLEPILHLCHN